MDAKGKSILSFFIGIIFFTAWNNGDLSGIVEKDAYFSAVKDESDTFEKVGFFEDGQSFEMTKREYYLLVDALGGIVEVELSGRAYYATYKANKMTYIHKDKSQLFRKGKHKLLTMCNLKDCSRIGAGNEIARVTNNSGKDLTILRLSNPKKWERNTTFGNLSLILFFLGVILWVIPLKKIF